MIPIAAIANRPKQPAAKHPPAIAPPTASSPLPLCEKPIIAPIITAMITIQIHIIIILVTKIKHRFSKSDNFPVFILITNLTNLASDHTYFLTLFELLELLVVFL